jgi:hypothetical protein
MSGEIVSCERCGRDVSEPELYGTPFLAPPDPAELCPSCAEGGAWADCECRGCKPSVAGERKARCACEAVIVAADAPCCWECLRPDERAAVEAMAVAASHRIARGEVEADLIALNPEAFALLMWQGAAIEDASAAELRRELDEGLP